MNTIIRTDNLSFSFGRQKVINDLCLKVPESSVFGFLGPNGAGKSTTIKLLLGLLTSGRENIFLFGREFRSNRYDILRNIGSLVESPSIYSNLTARENLRYMDFIFKMGRKRIDEVLKIIGLWDQRDKRVRHFSTGMKQRLGIGMALFHDPSLIILDEPVNGLDPRGVCEIRELLLNLQGEGKTIFVSSHLLSEVEKTCTHIGIISQGRLLFQGEMSNLLSKTSRSVSVLTEDITSAVSLLRTSGLSFTGAINNRLEFRVENNMQFNDLISFLAAKNIKIYDIETSSATLEEVFINLTSN